MKKLYFLLLLLTGLTNAQIINIPDANFKAKLLSASPTLHYASNVNPNSSATPNVYTAVDTNGNGEIEVSEASDIVYLNVNGGFGTNISSLEGIQYFTSLKWLYCSNNDITTLDVSSNLALTYLNCITNPLTSINFDNPYLTVLSCGANQLSTIDLQGCPGLLTFSCGANNLTTLSFANNPLLKSVGISHNPLTSIDVNSLQNLESLTVNYSNITSINVNNKPNLLTVNFGYNALLTNVELVNLPHCYKVNVQNSNISSIDLSTVAYLPYINSSSIINPSVYQISLNNNLNLTHINFKNGFANPDIDFFSPNLNDLQQYLCLDEGDVFSSIDYNSGSLLSTYCNFTPGGNYNTITGSMTFDANNNGCGPDDLLQPNIRVNINDQTNQGASFANIDGNYTFYTQSGSFDITPAVENPAWFTFSPTSATIPFADNNNNTATQNFCITGNGSHQDLEMVMAPIIPARPGFDAVYKLVYRNKGNTTMQASTAGIILIYNIGKLTYVSSSQPVTATGTSSINFDYPLLPPFASGSIEVTFHVNAPTDTPAVNIGEVLQFMTMISPNNNDENIPDNTFHYDETVVGSFDPNDITCLEGEVVPPSEIGKYLHYIINFENTGTADAENIVVKDIIDIAKFDVSSLQVLDNSHPVFAKLTGNVAEFIFQNINLHSGGHGNILLKIKSKNDLAQGDTVSKQANIFFDYNAPISTNMENTIFQALSTPGFEIDNSISIYPNPAKSTINIRANNTIKSVQLYDVQGRVLRSNLVNKTNTNIDISEKTNGIYFLKVLSDKGMKVEKIVKE